MSYHAYQKFVGLYLFATSTNATVDSFSVGYTPYEEEGKCSAAWPAKDLFSDFMRSECLESSGCDCESDAFYEWSTGFLRLEFVLKYLCCMVESK